MIYFVHIPKTSGKHLTAVMEGSTYTQFTREHTSAGWAFKNYPKAKFVTILREPISRTVSHLLHIQRTKDHPLYGPDTSLCEITGDPELWNLQTKYLCSDAAKPKNIKWTTPDLDLAKRRLERFFYVGFQSNQQALVSSLFKKLEQPAPEVKQVEVTRADQFDFAELNCGKEEIISANEIDLELYVYAMQRFGGM